MAESNATQVILTDDGIKIIKAQNTADNAAGGVTNLNDPNLISVIEKQRLAIQMDNFATIYAADKDIATSEGIDFTTYDAAYHAYLTYMTPLVADMTTYSPIVRATFNSMVTAVQAEQKRFNAATQAQYNQQINKAQTDISDGQTKYKALLSEAETMKSSVAGIADEADRAISSAGFASNMASAASQGANEASQAASSALASAMSAESNASSAVAAANSTASAFGPVSQKADSAFANAMSAQNDASSAVEQALSAAADSKDAKQIAGAVSQSYKTLTDGSTMTIAELQNGLGAKLTKTDLNGYATQDWSQNQIRMTANGINETISSIKGTVDSHTTSINDFQADSKEFKAQFTTVNGTLDKQSTDISTLQASSEKLSSNFDSLNTANGTNEHNISELQQTAKEVSSTLETVQTQVQNSAVGTNLITGTSDFTGWTLGGGTAVGTTDGLTYAHLYVNASAVAPGFTLSESTTYTVSFDALGYSAGTTPIYIGYSKGSDGNIIASDYVNATLNAIDGHSVRVSLTFTTPSSFTKTNFNIGCGNTYSTNGSVYIRHVKLEKGSIATDWCPNPEDTATVTAVSKLSQTVDGFKTDISKKIEQKDLNGYATETWTNGQIKLTSDSISEVLSKKIEKTDLNGYATQDWTQNQIKLTADGINGTLSSIKGTVDSHTTSINDFQADSEKFKAQFTTYKDTVDRHDRDISTLQADSKSLSSKFDSLNTDNGTNQHNISELQQSAKEFNSTLETVQTQVKNSAVGTNLIVQSDLKTGYMSRNDGGVTDSVADFHSDNYIPTNGATVFTFSSPDYVFKGNYSDDVLAMYDSNKNYLGYQPITSATQTLSKPNVAYIRFSINFNDEEGSTSGNLSDWLSNHRYKLEKGSVATDYSVNPEDTATVTDVSKLSQTAKEFSSTLETVQTQVQNSAVGTNLAVGTNQEYAMGYGIPTTTWTDGYAYLKLPTNITSNEILPQDPYSFWYALTQGVTYTQTIWFETDANVKDLSVTQITWFTLAGHDPQPATIQKLGQNSYKVVSTYLWPGKGDNNSVRLFDIFNLNSVFDLSTGTYLKFGKLKLEKGSLSTDWCPNPADTATVTAVSSISQTVHGLQNTISDKVSSSQLTELSGQLTNQIKDLASKTDSSFRQTANDINGMVKKGDVVNQFNLDAGGALLSTSGNSTKIVFSSPNIIFDSNNPVQIPNVNIPGTLTGKTFETGTITATTKIIGTDIEAPLVHSPSGSFKLDGKTGDIIGASIHSDNNSWGIDKDGNINGVNIVANTFNTNNGTFTVEKNGAITAKNMTLIGGKLTSPTINASTINGSTINGTTFNAGNKLNQYGNTSYPLTINPDGSVTSTSFGAIANDPAALRTVIKDGTVKTNFRGMKQLSTGAYPAADVSLGAGQLALLEGYSNSQDPNFTATGMKTTGYAILDASTGLSLHGTTQSITFSGTDQDQTTGITMDSYGNIYARANSAFWRIRDTKGNDVVNFGIDTANQRNISFSRDTTVGNLFLGVGHTIGMLDSSPLYFKKGDSNGRMLGLYAGAIHYENLIKSSLLSVKKDVKKADTAYWAQLVNAIDLATYQYKTDDNTSHIRLSSIVDDVNVTKQWQLPDVFVSRDEDGKLCGVDDSVLLNATLATVQEQQKEIDKLNGHNMELEARLNKLEAKLNG